MKRQPAYALYDFAVSMTLFFAAGLWIGGGALTAWIISVGLLSGLWLGASIVGRRYGLPILTYFEKLERPFYKSRDDYSPQD